MDFLQLQNICDGKSQSQGGANIPRIQQILTDYGITPKKARSDLNQQICELLTRLKSGRVHAGMPPPAQKAPPPAHKAPPPAHKAPPPAHKAPPPAHKAPSPAQKAHSPVQKAHSPVHKAPPKPEPEHIITMCHNVRRNPDLIQTYLDQLNDGSRETKYNIAVLASIASASGYHMPIMVNGRNINDTEFHGSPFEGKKAILDRSTFKPKLSYFMEDVYTDDLPLFLAEYQDFDRTGRSKFIYQSNLANMALAIMCQSQGCYNKYYMQFGTDLRPELDPVKFNHIFRFNQDNLLDLLITAYSSFLYSDIIKLYRAYMIFYEEAIRPHIYTFIEGTEIMPHIKQTKDYYLYLSFNLTAEYKCTRFFATKIAFSYIGGDFVHDGVFVSITDILFHDLLGHGCIDYTIGTDAVRREIGNFLLKIYPHKKLYMDAFKEIFNAQHESGIKKKLTVTDIIKALRTRKPSLHASLIAVLGEQDM